jgi:hypothetical protein
MSQLPGRGPLEDPPSAGGVVQSIKAEPYEMRPAPGAHPLGVRMGTTCVCHIHRERVPIELHHVWPLGMGGPNTDGNKIWVCANAHYSIHAYLDLLVKHGGQVPPEEARFYGAKVRRYAQSGYDQWRANQ